MIVILIHQDAVINTTIKINKHNISYIVQKYQLQCTTNTEQSAHIKKIVITSYKASL